MLLGTLWALVVLDLTTQEAVRPAKRWALVQLLAWLVAMRIMVTRVPLSPGHSRRPGVPHVLPLVQGL